MICAFIIALQAIGVANALKYTARWDCRATLVRCVAPDAASQAWPPAHRAAIRQLGTALFALSPSSASSRDGGCGGQHRLPAKSNPPDSGFLWSITWLHTKNTACAVIYPLIKSTLASSKPIMPDLTGHRYGEYNTMPNTRRKPADCWHCWHCCQSVAFTSPNVSLCRRSN